MLILSSYTDYYDRVATSGIDTTIRYHRQTTILKAPSPFHIEYLPMKLTGGYFDYVSSRSRHRRDWQDAINARSCDFNNGPDIFSSLTTECGFQALPKTKF